MSRLTESRAGAIRESGARVRYNRWRSVDDFNEFVRSVIVGYEARAVCELGAGANPELDPLFVSERGLRYVLVDISSEELAKAEDAYPKVVADVTAPDFQLDKAFDVVFSRTLDEHVREPAAFHRNVRTILRDGGRAVHFFPTLYALPFVVNRLLPDWVSEQALLRVDPRRVREGKQAKFPAFYRWCVGPTGRQLGRLSALGYEVEQYVSRMRSTPPSSPEKPQGSHRTKDSSHYDGQRRCPGKLASATAGEDRDEDSADADRGDQRERPLNRIAHRVPSHGAANHAPDHD